MKNETTEFKVEEDVKEQEEESKMKLEMTPSSVIQSLFLSSNKKP